MNELKEIKRRLSILDIRQNGYIKVEDVRSVIDFIEGLIYEMGVIDGQVERIISEIAIYIKEDVDLNEIKKVLREIIENDNTGNSRKS